MAEEDNKQLSKRKRKAQESWAAKKSDKKSKVEDNLDVDAPINPAIGEPTKKKKVAKATTTVATETENGGTEASEIKPGEKVGEGATGKNKRFILFVGNLSFKTTIEDLQAHIKPTGVTPLSVRMQTDAVTKKPKGFAFIDLPNFQSLDKVLNLHHTSLGGRKINVELTAGGGGSGEKRKAKIAKKNEKLDVERETAQKTRRETDAKKSRAGKAANSNGEEAKKKIELDMSDVNPARRKRIG